MLEKLIKKQIFSCPVAFDKEKKCEAQCDTIFKTEPHIIDGLIALLKHMEKMGRNPNVMYIEQIVPLTSKTYDVVLSAYYEDHISFRHWTIDLTIKVKISCHNDKLLFICDPRGTSYRHFLNITLATQYSILFAYSEDFWFDYLKQIQPAGIFVVQSIINETSAADTVRRYTDSCKQYSTQTVCALARTTIPAESSEIRFFAKISTADDLLKDAAHLKVQLGLKLELDDNAPKKILELLSTECEKLPREVPVVDISCGCGCNTQ